MQDYLITQFTTISPMHDGVFGRYNGKQEVGLKIGGIGEKSTLKMVSGGPHKQVGDGRLRPLSHPRICLRLCV